MITMVMTMGSKSPVEIRTKAIRKGMISNLMDTKRMRRKMRFNLMGNGSVDTRSTEER